jgi:hypothetical protein
MFRNVFVVDITEHQGLEETAIRSVQAYAADYEPVRIEWFKHSSQAQPPCSPNDQVFSVDEEGMQLWPQMRERLAALSTNGHAGAVFHVLAYNPFILMQARGLNGPSMTVRVKPMPVLITALRQSSYSRPHAGNAAPAHPQFARPAGLTVPEALGIATRVLLQYGHTSKQTALLRAKLRTLMTKADLRARKNPTDRSSSRLIPDTVAEGIRTGRLGNYDIEGIPGTEHVWLIAGPGEVQGASSSKPKPDGNLLGQSTVQSLSVGSGVGSVDVLKDQPTSHALEPSTPEASSSVGSRSGQTGRNSEDKGRKKTEEINEILKSAAKYSPQPQRDILYQIFRSCACGQPKTLLQLTREIRRLAEARPDPELQGYKFWRSATDGFQQLLLGAGLLLGEDGGPIADGTFARGARIVSFKDPIEDLTDAFLLETAINLAKLHKIDRVSLMHSAFWCGPTTDRDSMEDRFERVFGLLADRLVETPDGLWHVKPSAERASD